MSSVCVDSPAAELSEAIAPTGIYTGSSMLLTLTPSVGGRETASFTWLGLRSPDSSVSLRLPFESRWTIPLMASPIFPPRFALPPRTSAKSIIEPGLIGFDGKLIPKAPRPPSLLPDGGRLSC